MDMDDYGPMNTYRPMNYGPDDYGPLAGYDPFSWADDPWDDGALIPDDLWGTRDRKGNNMLHETKMKKEELLGIVKVNREAHRATFLKALDGYREHCEKKLQAHLDALKAGKTPEIRFTPAYPEDHTEDYDTVIRQLELHQEEDIVISGQEFSQFVEDNWTWKRQWNVTTNAYAVGAVN